MRYVHSALLLALPALLILGLGGTPSFADTTVYVEPGNIYNVPGGGSVQNNNAPGGSNIAVLIPSLGPPEFTVTINSYDSAVVLTAGLRVAVVVSGTGATVAVGGGYAEVNFDTASSGCTATINGDGNIIGFVNMASGNTVSATGNANSITFDADSTSNDVTCSGDFNLATFSSASGAGNGIAFTGSTNSSN